MDKKAIKTFAIDARKTLISEIRYRANLLGISAEGIVEPIKKSDGMEVYDIGGNTPYTIYDKAIEQRKDLVMQVEDKGFENVIEEVAYTWFNRIIALRFMEVNDYLPTRVRVLSSEVEGKIEPDIVTEFPNLDLDFIDKELDYINELKFNNKLDEVFRLLFIKQCNQLNQLLPELFEKTADYTELLLSISFINEVGIVRQLIGNISEEDFKEQVEIIGWLYQYYNTELKDETFKLLKKRVKISKERIPAATQLFTPDWIVRYMVENSLGRLWLEGHPNSDLKEKWKYYLDEAEQEPKVQLEIAKAREDAKNIKPEDIKIIDPAMGSGHILVYAFEVLMQIYTSLGYSKRKASELIIKNNLYGLDIDDRAYQLAYFAVMMKARSFDKNILYKKSLPNLCAIQESNNVSNELLDFVANDDAVKKDLKYLKETFVDAKLYGTILDVKDNINFLNLLDQIKKSNSKSTIKSISLQKKALKYILPLLQQSIILSKKYDVVVTNPPYMGSRNMAENLSSFLKTTYPNTKSDLSTVFMERTFNLCKKNGYLAMINIPVWMFLSTYTKLRKLLIDSKTFINMLHLGRGIFGSDFGTTAFIINNQRLQDYTATYRKLYEKQGAVDSIEQKRIWFFENTQDKFVIKQENFSKIPGNPIAYWVTQNILKSFEKGVLLSEIVETRLGMATADNDRFLRYWFEVDKTNIGIGISNRDDAQKSKKKWFPYNKGGDYRKWYGNNEYIVNWENDGYEIRNFKNQKTGKIRSHNYNLDFIFKEGLTWTFVSSSNFGIRYFPKGFLFDVAGSSMFIKTSSMQYILAFLSSKISFEFLKIINPTLNFQPGNLSSLPVLFPDPHLLQKIEKIVNKNISISKSDWDNFEISWDFKIHPLLGMNNENLIKNSYKKWEKLTQKRFSQLKINEEKINQIFIEVYNLKTELNPMIDSTEIPIKKANLYSDMKSFISYAVGCMLGRYSLDEEGLIFAGGIWTPSKYIKFIPDDDNIIPILDTEYFEDDIVGRFVEFVKVSFGEETLEENLDFIAKALKKKGTTSREVIRNYFLADFYKDHLKTYKKHPIYWLFDSGHNNGFKALIYMHRYEKDLVARVRTDYLHKTQKALGTAQAHNDKIIETSTSVSEKSKALKTKNKLVKQLEETKKYDEALAHVANQKIEINLDDGIKVNYAKFQGVEVSNEGQKAKKIDLLKKI